MLNHVIQILHSDTIHKTFLIILGLNRGVICTNMQTKIYKELNTYKEQTDIEFPCLYKAQQMFLQIQGIIIFNEELKKRN